MLRSRKFKIGRSCLFILIPVTLAFYYLGYFTHIFEKDFYTEFYHPYNGNIKSLIEQMRRNRTPDVPPINLNNYHFYKTSAQKCKGIVPSLVFLVKSAPENFIKRLVIRRSWGIDYRFWPITVRTVFLLGTTFNKKHEAAIEEEYLYHQDIVQANFTDTYDNLTLKTMMGFTWVMKFCKKARYYISSDDNLYFSFKNVLGFLSNPMNYPNYKYPFDLQLKDDIKLYSGMKFSKHSPTRRFSSKYYVSLAEYPYHLYPDYIGGAFVMLSREALVDLFYASFYTKHFKIEDVYIGILAFKAKLTPFNCEYIFRDLPYSADEYKFVISDKTYRHPMDTLSMWNEQRELGNA